MESTLTHDIAHDEHHDHKPKGLARWLFTTNHKDIGTLYLVFALLMFFTGGAMAMIIRAELFMPGLQLVEPDFFNQMTTMHALIMVFGAVMPAWVGFANWMIPMMIGAPDMALPRMNNWSFWILPFAFTMLLSTLFMESGGPAAGWTLYPPLSLQGGQSFAVIGIHIESGTSTGFPQYRYIAADHRAVPFQGLQRRQALTLRPRWIDEAMGASV